MSLINGILVRLNSASSLQERCKFAREICDRPGITFSYKDSLIINWLLQELTKQEQKNAIDIWSTLHYVLEQANTKGKGNSSLLLKNTFADVVLEHVTDLKPDDHHSHYIFREIVKCLSVVLVCPSTSQIFLKQPRVFLKILSRFFDIFNFLIQARRTPQELLGEFVSLIKRVFSSEAFTSEKVLDILIHDCLQALVLFVELSTSHSENDGSEKECCNLVTKWLKDAICHQRLNQGYKVVLKLENTKNRQVNVIRMLLMKLDKWLQSDRDVVRKTGCRLMTIILQGLFEKMNLSSLDLPFSILVNFSQAAHTFKGTDKILMLNQLFQVCARNPALFLRNGSITSSTKTNWFREQIRSVLNEAHTQSELETFFTLLLTIRPEIIEPHLETIWSMCWLNTGETQTETQTVLLCSLLKTYARLRQVPKLFSKLAMSVEKLSTSPVNSDTFPRTFLVQFSECIVSLPAGQTLELWQGLLNTINVLYVKKTLIAPSIVELCSAVLLHAKLNETDFPASKHFELKELLHNTKLFLQTVLKMNKFVDHGVLNLCYAWGEVVIMLKLYHSNADYYLNLDYSTIRATNDLFDISVLHPYLSAEEWKDYLGRIETTDEKLTNALLNFLVQKIRFAPILNHSSLEDVKDVTLPVSRYVSNFIYKQFQEEALQNVNSSYSLCDTVISWLPVLLPTLGSKKLIKLSQVTIKSMMVENFKHENFMARNIVRISTTFELLSLQTALLNSLWEEAANSISMKRKHDEDNANLAWKFLSRHSQFQQGVSMTNENKTLRDIKKAALEFNQQCLNEQQNDRIVNVKRATQLVQILCLFPLEDMEPANKVKCILGLFQLFCIIGTKNGNTSELCVIISQTLITLLSKVTSSRMATFFDGHVLLQKVFNRLKCSETAEERKWNMALFERLVYIYVADTDAQIKIEDFAKQLLQGNGASMLELETLQIIIVSFLSILRRYRLSNNVDLFQQCDQIVKALVKALSKKLLSTQNIEPVLVWRCLSCILNYHCRQVPEHMLSNKRRPKKFVKRHLATFETLKTSSRLTDAKSRQHYYELVELLCKNRSTFQKILPEEMFINIWDTVLNHTTVNNVNDMEQNMFTRAVSSLFRSFTPDELSVSLHKLNNHAISLMECGISKITFTIPLWNIILNTDFGQETPREVETGIAHFLNLLLPLLLQPLNNVADVVLPALRFIATILQKIKVPLRHSQVALCFQTCTSLNLSSLEAVNAIPLSNTLLTIYRRLLTTSSKVILQSVAPFLSALTTILKQLVCSSNQSQFHQYNEELRKAVVLCAQDFSKILAIMIYHKTEFCKQAGFLISDYISAIQDTTVHPLVKEQILLGLYKILDICDDHVTSMLQVSLSPGGREILKQLHADFTQHYKYRGKV